MPRYFFHVHDGSSLPDETGTELPNLEVARVQAVKLTGALLSDHAARFWEGEDWTVEVADEKGLALFTLIFMATVAPAVQGYR